MMTHDECREALHDHHFGELDPEHDAAVTQHLSTCADCALEYCRLRADLEHLDALQRAKPRPAVRVALRAKVAAEFRPGLREQLASMLSARVPLYQPAFVLLLVIALGALAWPTTKTPEHRTTQTVVEEFDGSNLTIVDHRIL